MTTFSRLGIEPITVKLMSMLFGDVASTLAVTEALVTVNNRLKFEIEIVHDLSCHPIV